MKRRIKENVTITEMTKEETGIDMTGNCKKYFEIKTMMDFHGMTHDEAVSKIAENEKWASEMGW